MDDGSMINNVPAMVSVIRTAEGELSTYHLTYLSQDGKKADVPVQRKICPVILPMSGGAVRLFAATHTLCIAEGIETALSAHMDHGLPTWAAVNAGNMAALVIPESIKHVYIVADADDNFTGQQAAYSLARRLKIAGGRETVKVILLIDQEQVVDSGFKMDMNDYVILHAAA
jgi:putative DNA primase/helicase